jgi:hypothetical protein
MKKYKVQLIRTDICYAEIEVEADSIFKAEAIVQKKLNGGFEPADDSHDVKLGYWLVDDSRPWPIDSDC